MPGAGRSPARIEADVAALQSEIGRERAAATAADRSSPRNEAAYHDAVERVTRATRKLVDYESLIPHLLDQHRRDVGARTARWAGGALAAESAALSLAVPSGAVRAWWLLLLGPLAVAGLATIPGAARRATADTVRPRVGAGLFALAGILTLLCTLGAVTPWLAPTCVAAAWLGLLTLRTVRRGRNTTEQAVS